MCAGTLIGKDLELGAAGTLIGKDLELGAARIFSSVGFGMPLVPSFAGDRFRAGSSRWAGCSPTALAIRIGLAPVVGYFAKPSRPRP